MLTKSDPDKPYPEKEECVQNTRTCTFNVSHVCHECGKPLCRECAVGIRHQPRLVKFSRTDEQGEKDRTEWHCQSSECLRPHYVQTNKIAGGIGGVIVGLLLLMTLGGSFLPLTLLAIALLLIGGYVAYKEWKLKNPISDQVSFLEMWPDFPA